MNKSTVLDITAGKVAHLASDSDKCYICLSPFERQPVASLESCQHVFCLGCILQWSQTANTCPVDRISFAFIHQRRCPGGNIQRKIKVRTQIKDDDDDEDEGSNAVICEECGRSDRGHQLLVCIQCDSGYHLNCLRQSLHTGPEWICPECAVSPQHTDGSAVEEEISDGELADLLAEAEVTASTSSRIRASTTNRPGSSAERRSQRIHSRASRYPAAHLRASSHVPKYLLRASRPAVTADEVAPLHHSDTSKSKTSKIRKRATRAPHTKESTHVRSDHTEAALC